MTQHCLLDVRQATRRHAASGNPKAPTGNTRRTAKSPTGKGSTGNTPASTNAAAPTNTAPHTGTAVFRTGEDV